jgi:hypothetical protein
MTHQPPLTLRIPRGLWADLEETVIQQDRQFLSEVARSLGLPVQEVLRRCLGTGATTSIPTLWTDGSEPTACPWWECHGDGLWRRCPRQRLTAKMPCPIHERSTPCPLARPDTDPVIRALRRVEPVLWNDELFWVDPTGAEPAFREDGTVDTEGHFIRATLKGKPVWLRRLNA